MAAHRGQVADRLDEVGLALAVAPDEHRRAGAERQVDLLPAAERPELQVPDVHPQPPAARRRPHAGFSASWARTACTACPPNWLPQRRDGLHRRRVLLAGDEPGEQRGRDRRHRDGVLDGLLDGPPALAGVLGVAGDLLQLRVLLQRADQQVQQPGADDGALRPRGDDAGDVLDQVDGGQQLVALAVGLHHRVLDAVVDHLAEVPGAHRPGVHEARRPASPGRTRPSAPAAAARRRSAGPWRRPPWCRRPSARSRSPGPRPRRRRRRRCSRCPSRGSITSCTWSSVNLELPPSTTTSPGLSSSASSLTVACVGSPEGTITQTTRGAVSASTSAGEAVDVPLARDGGRSPTTS